jgi:N-acetylglutamate synthase-like GNAT family acetyltransferase
MEWRRDEYLISTDRDRLNVEMIHDYLANSSYWAMGRSIERVRRSIENSLSFGVYINQEQVGFARVVTDYATFAWLADVFIREEYRCRGLSKWLVEVIVAHPQLQGLRRFLLLTRDAHGLYRRYGFNSLQDPPRWLEKLDRTDHP